MTGKREQILARLLKIGEGLHDWSTHGRNIAHLSGLESLPAYVLWDGPQGKDEDAHAALRRNSPAQRLGPKIRQMRPIINIGVAGPEETVGTLANEVLERVVGAIMHDGPLAKLILHDRLDWDDDDYSFTSEGGETVIEYKINLVITYVIKPGDLPNPAAGTD
jgi:hypothetical protein